VKITRLETLCLSRPHELEHQWVTNKIRAIQSDCAIVVIHTDAGLTGIGEASAYGHPLLIREWVQWLSPALVGRTPEQAAGVLRPYGRNGSHDAAVAGIDCALWDLRGRIAIGRWTASSLHGLAGRTTEQAPDNAGQATDKAGSPAAKAGQAGDRAGSPAAKAEQAGDRAGSHAGKAGNRETIAGSRRTMPGSHRTTAGGRRTMSGRPRSTTGIVTEKRGRQRGTVGSHWGRLGSHAGRLGNRLGRPERMRTTPRRVTEIRAQVRGKPAQASGMLARPRRRHGKPRPLRCREPYPRLRHVPRARVG
jgi:hypothetical protein